MNYKTCILIKQACYFEFFVNKKNLLVDMLNIRNDCVGFFFFYINAIFFKPYTVFTVAWWGGGWLQNYFSFWPVLNWDTTKRRKSHRLNPLSGARIVLSTRKTIEHTNCCDALPSNILETNVKLTQASVISIIVACHGRFCVLSISAN